MRFGAGYVELTSGHHEDGREYLRLAWGRSSSLAQHLKPAALPPVGPTPQAVAESLPPACSSCRWVQLEPSRTSKALGGERVILDPNAWRFARCRHPKVASGGAHLVDPSVFADDTYASVARACDHLCGKAGSHFEAAHRPFARQPRKLLPAFLGLVVFLVPIWALVSFAPHDANAAGLVAAAMTVGPFLIMAVFWTWQLSRRHL
ncbi:hypothetical protein [Pseudoroseomonas cervicalis]|uniref:hypothetical protein n=1 Tax=Teichococcus cervicalis TaxID=204525 RepID=UPI002786702F|nr:hypothetical protein [Pseudoroseomonas cervicalis]MDQ1081410.1 hypothetical protein [Pseudoroseomonas cervicalis]